MDLKTIILVFFFFKKKGKAQIQKYEIGTFSLE